MLYECVRKTVHLSLGRDLTLWTRETHRIQVDHQLIRQVVAATVMHVFSLFVVVQLLGPPDSPPRSWVREGENMDRPYSGLDWALLTAAFLGNVRITKALLGRSQGNDRPDGLLSTGLEVAASQGHFDTVVAFLEGSANRISLCTCEKWQKTAPLGAVFGSLSTTPQPVRLAALTFF
jgi:hypothetical protein